MAERPPLSVVLPTYNEAGSIGAVLDDVATALEAAGVAWEAVVVDDASRDGTHAAVEAASRRHPGRIRLIVRENERGLGSAVVRGFGEAAGEHVAVMDADGQHPAEALARMLHAASEQGADVVVGTRHAAGGSVGEFGPLRRLVSWGAAMAARVALPAVRQAKLSDPMSGLFLVRRAAVADVGLDPKGFKILLEVLARGRGHDGRRLAAAEVPYAFGTRRAGTSKLGAGVAFAFFWHLALLAWHDRENRRLAEFTLVGASGVFVNLGLLAAGRHFYGAAEGLPVIVSGLVARGTSIAWNFVWNDHITYRDRRRGTGRGMFVRFLRFNVVSLASTVVYLAVLWLLTSLGVGLLTAGAIAILLSFFLNFRGNTDWTYRPRDGRLSNRAP